MPEILKISGLGPIKNLKIEVKPLTVLVGPQASGKSLVAQVLYFFRTIRSELARKYTNEVDFSSSWQNNVVRSLLDELRGDDFSCFITNSTKLSYLSECTIDPDYKPEESDIPCYKKWTINFNNQNMNISLGRDLKIFMKSCVDIWRMVPGNLQNERFSNNIFIPTERTILTKFLENEPSVLYGDAQPLPFRRFADFLAGAKAIYRSQLKTKNKSTNRHEIFQEVMERQLRALKGEAYIPETGPPVWKFKINQGGEEKILPLPMLASGQMEAWPFFAVAATWGANIIPPSFFFEEPETHLHPAAQRIIVETIGFLVNKYISFFITTHSPYVLYTINNLMQTFMTYAAFCEKHPPLRMGEGRCGDHLGAEMPENHHFLDPKNVAAYRLTADGKAVSIIDKKTGMLDSDEVDATSNQLGREFDALLDLEEGRG